METKKVAVTPVYQKLDAAYRSGRYNVFVLEGGSRSSKTYSIIQFWVRYALEHQDRERRVIVSRLKATWSTTSPWVQASTSSSPPNFGSLGWTTSNAFTE